MAETKNMYIDRERLKKKNQEEIKSGSPSEDSLIDVVSGFRRISQPEAEEPVPEEAAQTDPQEGPKSDLEEVLEQPAHGQKIKNKTKSKIKIPGRFILLGVVVIVLLVMLLFKIFMDVSFKPVESVKASDHPKLNISISDNMIEVRNPNESNPGQKTGIIFYSDLRVEGECYLPLMIALSEKGYDCFLPTAFGNQPYLNLEGAESAIRDFPHIPKWILVGHSHSCPTAAVYAKNHPDKLDGLVFLGGYSDSNISNLDLPLLSLTGTNDSVTDMNRLDTSKANTPADSVYQTIQGGNNSGFANAGLLPGDSQAEITPNEQIQEAADQIDQFIQNRVLTS